MGISTADVICTCTGSSKPLFHHSMLKPTVHINAVGSYQPQTTELDPVLIERAGTLVVDTLDAWSSGDIGIPLKNGLVNKNKGITLGKLLLNKNNETSSINENKCIKGMSVF